MMMNMRCSTPAYDDIYNCSYGYLPTVDACFHKLIDHVIALKISFLQLTYLVLYHASLYLVPQLGLLASTFKVLIGLPLVI